MTNLIPQVHLFIALDSNISPGPILQVLDYYRAKEWQQETVLICDSSWKPFVNIDQPAIFMSKEEFYLGNENTEGVVNTEKLDALLEQLDNFEIQSIMQIGDLSWGRWLRAYIEPFSDVEYRKVGSLKKSLSSIEIINEVSSQLGLDLSLPLVEKTHSSAIYVDPYEGEEISKNFLDIFNSMKEPLPEWLNIVVRSKDLKQFAGQSIEENIVDMTETEMTLFNQFVLCFSDDSPLAQTSRAYNVATFNVSSSKSLFMQGDISIQSKSDVHLSELLNILAYWKSGRLKELAFQWFNMGIEICSVEFFHSRIVKRSLLNYSSDLHHCQKIVESFVRNGGKQSNKDIMELIYQMRKEINNDPYSLSFSLKLLLVITERMLASASCGERLFQRLGSDYHRIIIGEALVEGIIGNYKSKIEKIDLKSELNLFLKLLIEIDFKNDQADIYLMDKES